MEVTLYEPLYKFDPEVLELAKKIPLIKEIMLFLNNKGIGVFRRHKPGAALSINFDTNRVSIAINFDQRPIDVLAALIHEYWHVKQSTETYKEVYKDKSYYVDYMVNQEIVCYTKQAEFILDYGSFASQLSESNILLKSYREGTIKELVETRYFVNSEVTYRQYYENDYDTAPDCIKNSEWRLNDEKSRIPISA